MTVTISRLYNSYPDAQAAIDRLEASGVKHGRHQRSRKQCR